MSLLATALTIAAASAAPAVEDVAPVADAPIVQSVVVEVTLGSTGTPAPVAPAGCVEPELTVMRSARRSGRAYRCRGTLTCNVDGIRRPAPRGTAVEVSGRPALTVRAGGRIAARLAYGAARAITFRAHGAGGEVATVRIASSAAATAGR